MKNAHRLKILFLISISLVLVAGLFSGAYLLNKKWKNESAKWLAMKEQIVEDNSLVKRVYRIDNGPNCEIIIVLNSSASFDQIEAIYKSVLTQLCDEETLNELKTYHRRVSGELVLLEIAFQDPYDEVFISRFSATNKDGFEKWKVDDSINPDKKFLEYNMSDYATIYAG